MNVKTLCGMMNVVFVGLLFATLMGPVGDEMYMVVAVVWLINITVAALSALAALVLVSEGGMRQKLKDTLLKFFEPGEFSSARKIYGWAVKLLIVLSLALSGWIITLVCYLLAVVIYNLLRSQLTEPAAT